MKHLWFLAGVLTLVFACKERRTQLNYPYTLIPNETALVIKINALHHFLNPIEHHKLWTNIYTKKLKTATPVLKHLSTTEPIYISFSERLGYNADYLILTKNTSNLVVKDSSSESKTLSSFHIRKIQLNNHSVYYKIIGNTFAASNSIAILKALDPKKEHKTISRLIHTTASTAVASIVFKSNHPNYKRLLFSDTSKESSNSNYTVIDIDYTDAHLKYNGLVMSNDSITTCFDSFKHTIPQKIQAIDIAPQDTKSLTSITYDKFSVLNTNLQQLRPQVLDSTQAFLNFTNEIALTDTAVLLHAYNADIALDYIEGKTPVETFRTIEIFRFNTPDFFTSRLKPFITFNSAHFLAVYKEFIVFSDTIDHLKTILTNAINANTLANSDAFKTISKHLSDDASLFIFKNSEGLSKLLHQELTAYNANVVQFTHENNYMHINGIMKPYKGKKTLNTVSEHFSVVLDTEAIIPPQTLKNHITKTRDIAIQDANNTLYLISNSGQILWKKQLPGRILGEIEQIDRYNNGRLQLAFATENHLFVLDRNGKNVAPFPLKFNTKITQPVSVFDYDNNKNYRLLLTQGKTLLMYNAKGQFVKGFAYKNNAATISSQPKHFRIGKNDYIVFAAGKQLKILNRKGQTRVAVKDKIRFSNNAVYLYKTKFTTSNTLGELVQVNSKGKLNTINLNLPEHHHITTTSKTLVTMVENRLKIKSKIIDLDYGDYTKPRLFYFNDNIFISVTDKQANKVYLFDSQGNTIPNFPIYGTASAELTPLNGDSVLEVVTQSDAKTVTVYTIN